MSDVILYTTDDGKTKIDLRLEDGTVWLSQLQIADLFSATKQNISLHLKNIFADEELSENSVVKESLTTAADDKSYRTKLYNLEAILAVGYRVRSPRGSAFRRWASTVLKEYLEKGFAMNDERLKNLGGGNFWKELLARIRDIRSSEKVMYRQVLDLYATATDYHPSGEDSLKFFKMVQNKLHYAAHGHTASEKRRRLVGVLDGRSRATVARRVRSRAAASNQLIYLRVDSNKPFAGLSTFKGGQPTQAEAMIAKNQRPFTRLCPDPIRSHGWHRPSDWTSLWGRHCRAALTLRAAFGWRSSPCCDSCLPVLKEKSSRAGIFPLGIPRFRRKLNLFKRLVMFYNQSESEDGRWSGLRGFDGVVSPREAGGRGLLPLPGAPVKEASASDCFSRSYERELIQSVWEFAEVVQGNDPEIWRKDEFGEWIYRFDYGRRSSEFGWEVFDPGVGRHAQGVYAMRPMQWQSYIRQYETFA